MRQLRFRVWDSIDGNYRNPEKEKEAGLIWFNASYLESIDEVIIEQYTGLNDKNGKEICESDILITETEKPMVVKWNDKFASWCLYRDGWMFAHWFGESCNPEDCEIIGNIHENPEIIINN